MSIKQQVTKSVFWSAVERFSVQGVQFILSLIIARLLLPADYGLIAMLSIFMSIAQTFIDSGFANALIQKKDRTDADYSTLKPSGAASIHFSASFMRSSSVSI